jgi:predicted nucleotidyltransferase
MKEIDSLSDSSLSRALKRMVEDKILSIDKRKSNTFYEIKNKKVLSLKFSEIAMRRFENLNVSVKIPLKNYLKEISKGVFCVVLFGSSSRGEEKKGSDIDIMIVSDRKYNFEKAKEVADIVSNYPISFFICSIKDFEKGDDDLVLQAKKTGFPIYKEQNFYEVVLNEY